MDVVLLFSVFVVGEEFWCSFGIATVFVASHNSGGGSKRFEGLKRSKGGGCFMRFLGFARNDSNICI